MSQPTATLKTDLAAWYDDGDRAAGERLVDAIAPRIALPSSFGRVLGREVAEEVEQEVLVRLLDRERRLLLGIDDPMAFVATVARNLARDALKRHRCRGDLGEAREVIDEERTPAPDGETDATTHVDAARAMALLDALGEDARLAVYLTHAPARMPTSDWELLCARHGEAPTRPEVPLERDDASALLWPPPVPETRPARRLRLERIRKVLSRAYAELAAALGAR